MAIGSLGFTVAVANVMLDAGLTGNLWLELHVAVPDLTDLAATRAGNATRKQMTMAAAAGGQKENSNDMVWSSGEVDTAEDYKYGVVFNQATGGTAKMSGTINSNPVQAGVPWTVFAGQVTVFLNTCN